MTAAPLKRQPARINHYSELILERMADALVIRPHVSVPAYHPVRTQREPAVSFLTFDFWFRPKRLESERLYTQLGALVIKRYVPTGGDLVMRRLRRHHPDSRWVQSNLRSLRRFERRTRLNESVHLIGFVGGTVWAAHKFASGSLSVRGLSIALVLAGIFGLWPVTLQRYNRLRLYRAINTYKHGHRSSGHTSSM